MIRCSLSVVRGSWSVASSSRTQVLRCLAEWKRLLPLATDDGQLTTDNGDKGVFHDMLFTS